MKHDFDPRKEASNKHVMIAILIGLGFVSAIAAIFHIYKVTKDNTIKKSYGVNLHRMRMLLWILIPPFWAKNFLKAHEELGKCFKEPTCIVPLGFFAFLFVVMLLLNSLYPIREHKLVYAALENFLLAFYGGMVVHLKMWESDIFGHGPTLFAVLMGFGIGLYVGYKFAKPDPTVTTQEVQTGNTSSSHYTALMA
eukprot:TRINITY_DN46013_c0_g1_i1.p1 TRINITY_DN46013_c0_g1~~TRINITY_DN46013_c0_g1_i1.p1  ORF type:complete len:195 (+),score=14.10 TRINITY_DN46013_c0_g1_i1:586-1170(+)